MSRAAVQGPAELALAMSGSDGTGASECGSESGMEFGSESDWEPGSEPESEFQSLQPQTGSDAATFVRQKTCAFPTSCASVQCGRTLQVRPTQRTWMSEFVTHNMSF